PWQPLNLKLRGSSLSTRDVPRTARRGTLPAGASVINYVIEVLSTPAIPPSSFPLLPTARVISRKSPNICSSGFIYGFLALVRSGSSLALCGEFIVLFLLKEECKRLPTQIV